ncbi:MAG: hypothetical protein WDW38_005902 [Sanguina aurantia]
MPSTQPGQAPITTFCPAPASVGANPTSFQERCVPGALDAGWDNPSGLGTGQAWPGGADVNLAQQDVFDTLFGSWIMERSTSPEAFQEHGVMGKQEPPNDYFATMWEDSFICAVSPLQAAHQQHQIQPPPPQQQPRLARQFQTDLQKSMSQHGPPRSPRGEQEVPVMAVQRSCSPPEASNAVHDSGRSSWGPQPGVETAHLGQTPGPGVDRQLQGLVAHAPGQVLQRSRSQRIQAQQVQQRRKEGVERAPSEQAAPLQRAQSREQPAQAVGQTQQLRASVSADTAPPPPGLAATAVTHPKLEAPDVVTAVGVVSSTPTPAAVAPATLAPPPVCTAAAAPSPSLAPHDTHHDASQTVTQAQQQSTPSVVSLPVQQLQKITAPLPPSLLPPSLLPPSLPLPSLPLPSLPLPSLPVPWSVLGLGVEQAAAAFYPQARPGMVLHLVRCSGCLTPGADSVSSQHAAPSMDPSLLAALTAGWQPPPLPLGLGQLPPPTPGPWRPAGLPPLPPHMMLPPAVMLMHVQASEVRVRVRHMAGQRLANGEKSRFLSVVGVTRPLTSRQATPPPGPLPCTAAHPPRHADSQVDSTAKSANRAAPVYSCLPALLAPPGEDAAYAQMSGLGAPVSQPMGSTPFPPGIPPLPLPSLPGMPPLPFPSLANSAYPFLLPQPSAATLQLTPAQPPGPTPTTPPHTQPHQQPDLFQLPPEHPPRTHPLPAAPASVPPPACPSATPPVRPSGAATTGQAPRRTHHPPSHPWMRSHAHSRPPTCRRPRPPTRRTLLEATSSRPWLPLPTM